MENRKILERLESLAKKLDEVQNLMDDNTQESQVRAYSNVYDARCELEDLKEDIQDTEEEDHSPCGLCGGAVSICDGC